MPGCSTRQPYAQKRGLVPVEDDGKLIGKLIRLREAGISIAIDDFGVGYSSMDCLHRCVVDTVKINGSFVHSIVTMSRSPGVKQVIAEGVESVDQRQFLLSVGGQVRAIWSVPLFRRLK